MKVLFAVSNDKMSETIVKQYEKQYKEIISYKNVYYFNAILKELQRDKTYDRVVISEDLEQYTNPDHEQMDNFIFSRLDSISDEASNVKGEDIPIILICEERREKGEEILVKLFGIGIYNAILGSDRSINEVARLINRPRSKKEAKIYYKIDSEDVGYQSSVGDNEVSELEIQNILAHYKKIGNDEQKIIDSFESIATQYNNIQLKKYKSIKTMQAEEKAKGTSEIMLKTNENQLREPVVIPSAMSTNTKKVIKPKERETIKQEIDFEPIFNTEDLEKSTDEISDIDNINIEEPKDQVPQTQIEQTVKRGRGRPKKIVTEPVEQAPKRKRGRPRKTEIVQEEETVLPGFESESSIDNNKVNDIKPEEEAILPGFEIAENEPKNTEQESILPGFEEEQEEQDNYENILPGFDQEDNEIEEKNSIQTNEYSNTEKIEFNNLNTNQYDNYEPIVNTKTIQQYEELDINRLLAPNQKIVSFVGTSKNGTSFLVNNVAQILSMNNVNTAILDLTQNRNAYYIYTKNEENLRIKANDCIKKLKEGIADGIEVNKNLTVYTSAFDVEEIENVEPIIQTLLQKHSIILLDCDFETSDRYFKYSQEIYLVQSMDILTIQPFTLFLRKLSDKGALEEEKVRVVLNKYAKTKELNEDILVGGISIYNDASMTVRKELFNRKTVKRITVPLEIETYLRYLDGLVVCDVSLKGYSKKLLQSLKQLATLVYGSNGNHKNEKYTPPSAKNTTFSPSMNSTLEQMSKRY